VSARFEVGDEIEWNATPRGWLPARVARVHAFGYDVDSLDGTASGCNVDPAQLRRTASDLAREAFAERMHQKRVGAP
jgi:hypothetical protein